MKLKCLQKPKMLKEKLTNISRSKNLFTGDNELKCFETNNF